MTEQELREHNRRFAATIRKEVPDYYAMITDPKRRTEAQSYIADVYDWINLKPHSERKQLMEIATKGRNAMKVAALIKQFERERKEKGVTSQEEKIPQANQKELEERERYIKMILDNIDMANG
jgi:hypothetical protein